MTLPLNSIIHGDCLEVLGTFPNGSVDLIVTDPPYGDGIGYGRNDKEIANNEDETINYKVLPILYEKLKVGGYATFSRIGSFHPEFRHFWAKKHHFSCVCS